MDRNTDAPEAHPDVRIVLVGKTGGGKSATANTILGKNVFSSHLSAASVTSECQKETTEVEGQTVAVVDTPGLFDTKTPEDKLRTEVARCISLSAPGPHVFLIIIQLNRFTEEEQKTVKLISKMFGKEADRYAMALFTHGDLLDEDKVSIDTIIAQSPALCTFINQCRGGYHVFNNRAEDPSQVKQLLEKIQKMVQKNGGSHYTNDQFIEAGRAIREEQQRLLKEDPNMDVRQARRKAEHFNNFVMVGCSLSFTKEGNSSRLQFSAHIALAAAASVLSLLILLRR